MGPASTVRPMPAGRASMAPTRRADSAIFPAPTLSFLVRGGGDGGDDAGRQGDHEGRGQVVDGDGLLVAAVQAHRQLLGVAQGALEEVLDLDGVQIGGDGHHGGAEGDGDGNDHQGLQDLAGALRLVGGRGQAAGPVPPVVADHQVEQGHQAAGGDAADGPGGGNLAAEAQVQQVPGQKQAHDELGEGPPAPGTPPWAPCPSGPGHSPGRPT